MHDFQYQTEPTMNIQITIPVDQYDQLTAHSVMLGRIASVVSRYAKTPMSTTYECVVALNDRERELSKKVNAHKKAGGKFLK